MTEGRFKIIFDQLGSGEAVEIKSHMDSLADAMRHSREIREMVEAIEEEAPSYDPILSSGT